MLANKLFSGRKNLPLNYGLKGDLEKSAGPQKKGGKTWLLLAKPPFTIHGLKWDRLNAFEALPELEKELVCRPAGCRAQLIQWAVSYLRNGQRNLFHIRRFASFPPI